MSKTWQVLSIILIVVSLGISIHLWKDFESEIILKKEIPLKTGAFQKLKPQSDLKKDPFIRDHQLEITEALLKKFSSSPENLRLKIGKLSIRSLDRTDPEILKQFTAQIPRAEKDGSLLLNLEFFRQENLLIVLMAFQDLKTGNRILEMSETIDLEKDNQKIKKKPE